MDNAGTRLLWLDFSVNRASGINERLQHLWVDGAAYDEASRLHFTHGLARCPRVAASTDGALTVEAIDFGPRIGLCVACEEARPATA